MKVRMHAILAGAEKRGIKAETATAFESVTGKGIKGQVGGRSVAFGNRALLDELKIEAGTIDDKAEQLYVSVILMLVRMLIWKWRPRSVSMLSFKTRVFVMPWKPCWSIRLYLRNSCLP